MEDIVHGASDARFGKVRSMLADNIRSGVEVGASIVVDLHGEMVADLWGGYADAGRARPWSADTIVNVWSSTKTVTTLAALMLVDRGDLDVFEQVATYWPEFAANGKEAVEVRHIMSHTSGVSGWDTPFSFEDMYDWEKSTSLLAAQAPSADLHHPAGTPAGLRRHVRSAGPAVVHPLLRDADRLLHVRERRAQSGRAPVGLRRFRGPRHPPRRSCPRPGLAGLPRRGAAPAGQPGKPPPEAHGILPAV